MDPSTGRKCLWKGTAFPAPGALPPMEQGHRVVTFVIVCKDLRNRNAAFKSQQQHKSIIWAMRTFPF